MSCNLNSHKIETHRNNNNDDKTKQTTKITIMMKIMTTTMIAVCLMALTPIEAKLRGTLVNNNNNNTIALPGDYMESLSFRHRGLEQIKAPLTGDFCWRDMYTRGVGTIPLGGCPVGMDKTDSNLFCYENCPRGYNRQRAGACLQNCPPGWADDGLFVSVKKT